MWVVVIAVIGRLWNDRIIRDCRISGTSALIRRKEAKRCEMDLGIAKYHFEVGADNTNFDWV